MRNSLNIELFRPILISSVSLVEDQFLKPVPYPNKIRATDITKVDQ